MVRFFFFEPLGFGVTGSSLGSWTFIGVSSCFEPAAVSVTTFGKLAGAGVSMCWPTSSVLGIIYCGTCCAMLICGPIAVLL